MLESAELTPLLKWLYKWFPPAKDTLSRNLRNVLLDGIGVGFASAASPFLPVLLARLGATDLDVGLVTAIPAFAGFIFALPVGRFLSRQRGIVPWFSTARFLIISAYALIGLATVLAPELRVSVILIIWAMTTFPQTIVDVSFTVVMAGAAGPERRFYLMSRRWSFLGATTAVTVALTGLALDRLPFPLNYQIVFPVLALGGVVSYRYSSRIILTPGTSSTVAKQVSATNPWVALRNWLGRFRAHSKFVRFTLSQSVYRMGLAWAIPLFPLYYVRTLRADDAAIGLINTVQSGVLLVAYFMWARVSRRRGVRFALLATTGAIALYPIALAMTHEIQGVVILAGLAGIFAAGIDLTFFDTLASSFPAEASTMFTGLHQTTVYIVTFVGPLLGTTVAEHLGIPAALVAAGILRLIGFLLFVFLLRG